MERIGLEEMSRDTLIKLIKVYSRNWQTLDGLWFSNVEAEFGLEAASRLDLLNWEKQAALEASRIKAAVDLKGSGLSSILTVLSLMSWQLISPSFECETETSDRIVFGYKRCAVQEGRSKRGKPVFACKRMKLTLLRGIAGVVEPGAKVRCLSCPPDPPGSDYWCRWELSLPER